MEHSELINRIYGGGKTIKPSDILYPDDLGLPKLKICTGTLCSQKKPEHRNLATDGEECPECYKHDLFKMCKIVRVNGKIMDDPEAQEEPEEILEQPQ